MEKTPEERLIEELVDDAFAPFEHLLPPDALAVFKDELADDLATHPYASLLVRRALPDPSVHGSGDVDRSTGAPVESDEAKTRTGRG